MSTPRQRYNVCYRNLKEKAKKLEVDIEDLLLKFYEYYFTESGVLKGINKTTRSILTERGPFEFYDPKTGIITTGAGSLILLPKGAHETSASSLLSLQEQTRKWLKIYSQG